jgi:polysaccharide biosynthesis transport protein
VREGPQAMEDEASVSSWGEVLQRRKWSLIAPILGCLAVAAGYMALAPARYQSVSRLLLEPPADRTARRDVADPFAEVYAASGMYDVPTQIQVLKSQAVVDSAVQEAGVDPVRTGIEVKRLYDTQVVAVLVRSTDPVAAQRLARSIPEVYMNYLDRSRSGGVSGTLRMARDRLAREERQLADAEQSLERLKSGSGISELDIQRELSVTDAAQAAERVRMIELEVRGLQDQLVALERAYRSAPAMIQSDIVRPNPHVLELEQRLQDLQTERQKLLVIYQDNHTKIQEIDTQIGDVRRRLSSAPRSLTEQGRIANPALIDLQRRIADVRAQLEGKRGELQRARAATREMGGSERFNAFERSQSEIQRRIELHRVNMAQLAADVRNLSLREESTRLPVSVLESGSEPVRVSPKGAEALLAALLMGGMLGLGLAALQERLDSKIRTWQQAQAILDVPVLSFVPSLRGKRSSTEAYRILRTNLQYSVPRDRPHSIAIASTGPGEGKSTTALHLAGSLAADGKRVILVDADIRNASIHLRSGIDSAPGLLEVLRGEATLAEALQTTDASGVNVLPAGDGVEAATELLNSKAMQDLHRQLKELADVVIFDGPSFLSAADAQILASLADGLVFVLRPGHPREPALAYAAHLMGQAGARVYGVVFNDVDLREMEGAFFYGSRRVPYGPPVLWHPRELTGRSPSELNERSGEAGRGDLGDLPEEGGAAGA